MAGIKEDYAKPVTPAKAGVQFRAGRAEGSFLFGAQTRARWIPASAAMTVAWIARRKVTPTLRMRQLATRRRL